MDDNKDKKIIKSPHYSLDELKKYSNVLKRGLEDLGISATNRHTPGDITEFTELAKIIFVSWVADFIEGDVFLSFYERYKSKSEPVQSKYIEQYFVYLIAGIAIVLMNEYARKTNEEEKRDILDISIEYEKTKYKIIGTILGFKNITRQVITKIYDLSEDDIDNLVRNAGSDYSKFLFADPTEYPALFLKWSVEWFKKVGIEETNPEVLSQFGEAWISNFIYLSKTVSELLTKKLSRPTA